jgi:hypothetical protein
LSSKLERLIGGIETPLRDFRFIENSLIGAFKRQAKAVLPQTPSDNDVLGWLTLMQHYRAPTRLLDWTESPFVALHFAIEDQVNDHDGAIWVLNPRQCAAFHSGIDSNMSWDHIGTRSVWPGAPPQSSTDLPTIQSWGEEQNFRFRQAHGIRSRWPLPQLPVERSPTK